MNKPVCSNVDFRLTVFGNQENPLTGNPIGYVRMTQRSKYKSPRAKRYLAWKKYLQECWLEKHGRYPDFDKAKPYKLDVWCYLLGARHADLDNIRKGIQDALFSNGDKHVSGGVEAIYVRERPRVEIIVTGINEASNP